MAAFINEPQFLAYQVGGGGGFGNRTVVDTVPPELLHMIDPHWYKYPPMNELWFGILGFVMAIIGVVSIIGNGMVIFIFTTTKHLRTPSNIFVINLAVADFCIMLMMSPPMVVNSYYETWVFGPLMCELYAFVGSLCGCVSIWTMALIAFDRYNVIVKGISGKPLSANAAIIRVLIVWIASLFWGLAPFFGWNRYVPEGNMTACGTDYLNKDLFSRSYLFVYSIFVYYTPLLLICYSYFFILQAVSAHEKAMREQAKKMNVASLRSSDDANKSAEGKLAKIALMTISLWFMAWTPYLAINMAGIFGARHLSPLATIWGSVFAKFNAVYNPIVYGISHPKYREELFKRFPSLQCGVDETAHTSDAQSTATTTASTDEKA